MLQRFGYNTNAQQLGNQDYFIAHHRRSRREWALLMSDYDLSLARQLTSACPTINIAERFPNKDEKTEWRFSREHHEGTLASWKALNPSDNIYFHWLNEPELSNPRELAEACARMLESANQQELRLILPNLDMSYSRDSIQRGDWDVMLYAFHKYNKRHVLGLHEYAAPSMPNSVKHPAYYYLNRNFVQPVWNKSAAWETRDELTLHLPDYPDRNFLRRSDWFVLRCMELGISIPRIVLTEFGWDNLSNISFVYDDLEKRFGYPEQFAHKARYKGHLTYPYVWQYYWPQWTYDEALIQQLTAALDEQTGIYPEWLEAALGFSWTKNPEWEDTDFSINVALHHHLEQIDTLPDEEQPETDMTTYDLLPYLRGDNEVYRIKTSWAGTEIMYTETLSSGDWFQVKNELWEHLGIKDGYIMRGADISPGGNEMYIQFDATDTYGARWLPQYMKVGDSYPSIAKVRWYYQDKEEEIQPSRTSIVTSYLRLEAVEKLGTFDDVATFAWYTSLANMNARQWEEKYHYAKGYGLVGWKNREGKLSTWLESVNPSLKQPRKTIWLSDHIPTMSNGSSAPSYPALPASKDPGWKLADIQPKGTVNVRTQPDIQSKIKFVLSDPVQHFLHSNSYRDGTQHTWLPIQRPLSEQIGWVRSDVIDFTLILDEIPEQKPRSLELEFQFQATDEEYERIKAVLHLARITLR